MKYKIVADSCCDMSKSNGVYGSVELIPLTLYLEDKEYKTQWDISDYTYLQPKTFVDYVRFAYFIQKNYLIGGNSSLV